MARQRLNLPTDLIVSGYKSGDTLKLLASRYHTSTGTIAKRLREAGIEIRGRGPAKAKIVPDALLHDVGKHLLY